MEVGRLSALTRQRGEEATRRASAVHATGRFHMARRTNFSGSGRAPVSASPCSLAAGTRSIPSFRTSMAAALTGIAGPYGLQRSAALTRLIIPTMAACAQLRCQTRQPESE